MAKVGETELKNQIKNGDFYPVYLIYGEESYLKEYYVKKLKDKLVDDSFADFNFHQYEGKKVPLSDILNDADMMPVMSEHTFLLVHDFPLNKSKNDIDLLKEYLTQANESAVIVFWCDSIEVDVKNDAKWKSVISCIDKSGVCVDMQKRNEGDLVKIIVAKAKSNGSSISPNDAKYLIATVGDDIKTIISEVEKLSAFAHGGVIDRKIIDDLAVKSLQAQVFDLSKYILAGNSDGAYGILRVLSAQKQEAIPILSIISSCYIDMYRVKCAKASGLPETDVANFFNYKRKEWKLKKAASNAKNISIENIRNALDLIAKTDEMLKSTPIDDYILLEETVTKLIMLRNG